MFNARQALLKTIPCLSHGNTYLKHPHVLHMGIFVLLSQHLHDRKLGKNSVYQLIHALLYRTIYRCIVIQKRQ